MIRYLVDTSSTYKYCNSLRTLEYLAQDIITKEYLIITQRFSIYLIKQ